MAPSPHADAGPPGVPVRAYIAVGSNIQPMDNIPAAWTALRQLPSVRAVGSSRFWRTRPVGRADQPDFVNGAWAVMTSHDPATLKAHLRAIEDHLGRQHSTDKNAPRTIDLDLILYGALADPDRRLPHPDLARPFVYGPILELLASDPQADAIRRLIHDHLGRRAAPASTPTATSTATPGPVPDTNPPGIYVPELTTQLRAAIP